MSMTETNVQTDCTPIIVDVFEMTDLPYVYQPYNSIEAARAKHPCSPIYVFHGKAPKGWKIIAHPVILQKPEKEEADE
jgi:hypothetical protein